MNEHAKFLREESDAAMADDCPVASNGLKRAAAEIERLTAENSNWQETARQNQKNTDFYRGIVTQIGERFGREARTSDDGSVQEDVLALKVPELVESLFADVMELKKQRDAVAGGSSDALREAADEIERLQARVEALSAHPSSAPSGDTEALGSVQGSETASSVTSARTRATEVANGE